MRSLSLLLLLVLGQVARSQPTAQELITTFRKTIGAEAMIASVPYLISYRGERHLYSLRDGKLHGESYDFTGKLLGYTDNPHKHRKEIEMKVGVVPIKMVEVIDGETGWYQLNDGAAVAMSQQLIQGRWQRELHAEVFLGRETFDPKHWKFSEPQSSVVRGQEAWKFEAKSSVQEPITLYFAKKSSLLLRLKSKATDFTLLPGEAVRLESYVRDIQFYNWKKFGPRMLPGQFQVFNDGVLTVRMEPVEVSFAGAHNPALFVKPEPVK
jgi:hypothetical protein